MSLVFAVPGKVFKLELFKIITSEVRLASNKALMPFGI